jgi:hypothetical protein
MNLVTLLLLRLYEGSMKALAYTCCIRHMPDTARVCERMRVYVHLVDGLYRRAELNKHPHCLRVPALARPQQRCPAPLPSLAGDYSTEVNWIR